MLRNEYINPFGLLDECDNDRLLNLSSGVPVNDDLANGILSIISVGEKLAGDFPKELSPGTNYHVSLIHKRLTLSPVKKEKLKLSK